MSIRDETLVSGIKARQAFPIVPSESTYWRWMLNGVGGVLLESIVIGGRRYVSLESIDRFIEARNAKRPGNRSAVPNSSTRIDKARKALDALGI